MSRTTMGDPVRVEVTLKGDVGYRVGDDARAAVERAIAAAGCPVRWARVMVEVRDVPGLSGISGAAGVEAVLDVGGTLVRAGTIAPTAPEAVDVVGRRLSAQLVRLGCRAQSARRVPRRALR